MSWEIKSAPSTDVVTQLEYPSDAKNFFTKGKIAFQAVPFVSLSSAIAVNAVAAHSLVTVAMGTFLALYTGFVVITQKKTVEYHTRTMLAGMMQKMIDALSGNPSEKLTKEQEEAVVDAVSETHWTQKYSPRIKECPFGTSQVKMFDFNYVDSFYGEGAMDRFLQEDGDQRKEQRASRKLILCERCNFYWGFETDTSFNGCNCNGMARSEIANPYPYNYNGWPQFYHKTALDAKDRFPEAVVLKETISHSLVIGRGKVLLKSTPVLTKTQSFDKTLDKIQALVG